MIDFYNGSSIITLPYGENSLGSRATILIVDEFVRTEKNVISRVFVPMLTSPRRPLYGDLTADEIAALPEEDPRQIYLSSIRRADEWSYEYYQSYIQFMEEENDKYFTVAIPYQLGVKNRYISRSTVEQSFRENEESREMLYAEYCCIPERSTGNSFYKYNLMDKCRDNTKAYVAMSTLDYITYKDKLQDYPYYIEKLPGEIRIITMDIALIESENNDNTSIFIIRLVYDGDRYKRIVCYGESMHGLNSIIQVRRLKQLFYECECDYAVIDTQGAGVNSLPSFIVI